MQISHQFDEFFWIIEFEISPQNSKIFLNFHRFFVRFWDQNKWNFINNRQSKRISSESNNRNFGFDVTQKSGIRKIEFGRCDWFVDLGRSTGKRSTWTLSESVMSGNFLKLTSPNKKFQSSLHQIIRFQSSPYPTKMI